jgi:hypothetical protein
MVNPIQYQMAALAWPVLTATAANESKITYLELNMTW